MTIHLPWRLNPARFPTARPPLDVLPNKEPAVRGFLTNRKRHLRGRLSAYQQRQLAPLPIAVDILEPQLTKPSQLSLHIQQSV